MMRERPGRRMAAVYEAPASGGGSAVQSLLRIGWRVRAVQRELSDLLEHPADLWVVDLASPHLPPGRIVGQLLHLGATVPLLVVAAAAHLLEYREELADLRDAWPAAQDLLVRPYPPEELITRIAWMTEGRTRVPAEGAVYEWGPLVVDTGRRSVRYGGNPVTLTARELKLLAALAAAQGRVVSHATLARLAQGDEAYDERAAKLYIWRLRRALTRAGAPCDLIGNAYGEGYFLNQNPP